ncbi:MAG TPA: 50S ribosomal protein L25 [Gemmatimonadales bacterium]|nr:50S ribosomal protein L25 [Gemmatimonadales bacterium]
MATQATLSAEPRSVTGKGAARELRRRGRIPAVIYGHHREPQALDVDATAATRLLQAIGSAATLVDVTITGREPVKVLIREVQRNPVRPVDIIHLDLYEISADEKITVEVPVHLVGIPDGVRNSGGVLDHLLHRIEIRVFPKDLPNHVEVDVTALTIGHGVFVRDITVANAEILNDPGQPICTVVPPRTESSETPAAVAEIAEPELIRKPKAEEEGEAEE